MRVHALPVSSGLRSHSVSCPPLHRALHQGGRAAWPPSSSRSHPGAEGETDKGRLLGPLWALQMKKAPERKIPLGIKHPTSRTQRHVSNGG